MPHSDICLLLEGTYPYVRGGVSSWVHQLIQGLPQYRFYLVFIGGTRESYGPQYFSLPDNVVGLETHYIMEPEAETRPRARQAKPGTVEEWKDILSHFLLAEEPLTLQHIDYLLKVLGTKDGFTRQDFLFSKQAWDILTELYLEHSPKQSFVDYFWTFRNIYSPLFKLANIARQVPSTRVVHTISTGFAGFLGVLLQRQQRLPFLVSEHGIYTKERKIDLTQATWIKDRHHVLDNSIHRSLEHTRKMWMTFFEQLGRSAYTYATQITALYEGNRERQIRDGAPLTRTGIVVNGIRLERFAQALAQRPSQPPKVAGLIGRVVPIKDIKTFIRTITIGVGQDPDLQGWIVGPFEEDPSYYHECELLVQSLGMQQHIKFLGMQNITEILPQLGVCVLTSISEAQPLVLLEAMACAVPCVATDVGACREIIEGMTEEDQQLGRCGYIVDIASPKQTATAIATCLADPQQWRQFGDSGLARVRQYYQEAMMFERFNSRYQELLTWQE